MNRFVSFYTFSSVLLTNTLTQAKSDGRRISGMGVEAVRPMPAQVERDDEQTETAQDARKQKGKEKEKDKKPGKDKGIFAVP